jgi:hypothetical protein
MRPLHFCRRIASSTWLVGSSLLVQWNDTRQDNQDLLAQWPDGQGFLSLKKLVDAETVLSSAAGLETATQTEFHMIHGGGYSSAVWLIGKDTICKVKAKYANVCNEASIIAFVRDKLPSLPLPHVLYSHENPGENCTALFLQRLQGQTLRDAWDALTKEQREKMVEQVTGYCKLMAGLKSEMMAGINAKCLLEPYLYTSKDTPLAPLTVAKTQSLFNKYTTERTTPPDVKGFHFYHADLGPGNIMVQDGAIVAIIDWESAGYYPRFWIATKPSVSPGLDFYPSIPGVFDHEWREMLKQRLIDNGYPWAAPWWTGWRKLVKSEWV